MDRALEDLAAENRQDAARVHARQRLVWFLDHAMTHIAELGFHPTLENRDGLVRLILDPDGFQPAPAQIESAAPVAMIAPPDPVEADGPAEVDEPAPQPEPPVAEDQVPAPAEAPEVKPEAPAAADKFANVWTDDEDQVIVDEVLRGCTTAQIADQLTNRTEGAVSARRAKLKYRIAEARKAKSKAPTTASEPPAAPEEPEPAAAAPADEPPAEPEPSSPAPVREDAPRRQTVLEPAQTSGTPIRSDREVEAHLNALGYEAPWSAEKDLKLVTVICRGRGLPAAAGECRVTTDQALARWHALTPDKSLEWQTKLTRALHLRAKPT